MFYIPQWENWSGSVKIKPDKIYNPADEQELCEIVRNSVQNNKKIRVTGAGHSSSPLFCDGDVLVSLDNFKGVLTTDKEKGLATLLTGLTVHEAGEELLKHQLALHNTGDVDVQTLAGAIGTGTHGSGIKLGNLSSILMGVRMVNAEGNIVEYDFDNNPEIMKAARVALGTLGIFTQIKIKVLPAYELERREYCTTIDHCMQNLQDLIQANRNFDFYWYPRTDETKIRIMNLPGEGMNNIDHAQCVMKDRGWGYEILPRTRELKFDEMEYALPFEAGPACFNEVRKRIKAKHRKEVAWRLLYRTIQADDTYISQATGKNVVTISLHHNAGMPFDEYFNDIEPIFLDHGGRPHWGKKHNLKAAQLKEKYPDWEKFNKIRKKLDPQGVFLNNGVKQLLVEED